MFADLSDNLDSTPARAIKSKPYSAQIIVQDPDYYYYIIPRNKLIVISWMLLGSGFEEDVYSVN